MLILKEYRYERVFGWRLLIRQDLSEKVEEMLFSEGERITTSTQRSICHLVHISGDRRIFRKLLRHGGVLAPFLGGLYISRRRLKRLLAVSERLREAGVRTPSVLAVGWYPLFPSIYNLLIVTEWIDGAVPLGTLLSGIPSERKRRVVAEVAELIHLAFEAGVEHTDMHPDNILLDEDGRLYLTDIETASLHSGRVPFKRCVAVMVRLGRALIKRYPGTLSLADMVSFLRIAVPEADVRSVCNALTRDIRFHSLFWWRR